MTKQVRSKTPPAAAEAYRYRRSLVLTSAGLCAFIALLAATVVLAMLGQTLQAAFAGTGAVTIIGTAFYKLLTKLADV